jgi:hypothetical protein
VTGSHVPPGSTVHNASLGALAHVPPPHTSTVQETPSSQGAMLGVLAQPVVPSHPSSVQTFPSSHDRANPPTHAPAEHRSSTVQTFPSSHDVALST